MVNEVAPVVIANQSALHSYLHGKLLPLVFKFCILVLNRHCGSLSELNISEWIELKTIIDKLEFVYKEVLGAELSNWSCLLNNFYKKTTPNPHLHIHVRPRYKNAIVINDHSYEDTEFAHHYALKKESLLLDDDRQTLYALMKKHFN